MIEKGISHQSRTLVCDTNTAIAMGSGDLKVFATPSMIALMENAAMTAVAAALPEGMTTVGAEMDVTHIKPSGLGAEIVATAVVTAIEGRKLTFNVGARDAEGMIGEGVHIRYMVDRAKFMAKVKIG
ncbi:MAG: thioesterase family protein [Alistipes sp.]